MAQLQWKIGDVTVTRVVEQVITAAAGDLLPLASHDAIARHAEWLQPWAIDADDRLQLSIHALCVEANGQKLVVDTCFGPGPLPDTMRERCDDGSFLAALADADFARGDVDVVICTHLHVDHVGWNTMVEDGRRVPTFPNARYVLARAEFEHWHALSDEARSSGAVIRFDNSVVPLLEHGVVDLVEPDHRVNDVVRLTPTPGHSPGHVSVLITSQGETALVTGDCAHTPVQFAEPDWSCRVDFDAERAAVTRRRLIADYADTPVLVIGTHFPPPTAGHLVTTDVGVRFRPLA
jgi:glyoxylase-like metal-dependent hydrolase (beta-lactamase superfamily II)